MNNNVISHLLRSDFTSPITEDYNKTRTAWAVFKYCGTKTATLGLSIRS